MNSQNNWYSSDELKSLGIKEIGNNVLISKDARILNPEKLSIKNNVRIDSFCLLSGDLKFGNYIHLPPFCSLSGGGGIEIGDFVTISTRLSVFTANADFTNASGLTNPTIPVEFRKRNVGPVKIEKHVMIGAHSVILPNSTLKQGAVFGAFSLIKGEYNGWSLYVGAPAKFLRKRPSEKVLAEEEKLLK